MLTGVSSTSVWSREQDKQFEKALATHPENSSDRWEKISVDIPGKSPVEVKNHYELLIDDVSRIESGCIPLPCYSSSSDGSTSHASDEGPAKKGGNFRPLNGDSGLGGKALRSDQERRKGIAWTEEEHRVKFVIPSPGLHLALDACAAAAVATFLGVPLALCGKSFSTFIPVHGRSEWYQNSK
ncbi:transcription factor SRM1-like [Olea europaea var. sylvestris]|uniref:transcription factor SRM1-like n=1 Tax=Olea europaea var. sylvestris TaxID=158386 RepID=UPI000C1D243E|nr:transcription factor SRM1-like [Olea europaea var. sylvestris]